MREADVTILLHECINRPFTHKVFETLRPLFGNRSVNSFALQDYVTGRQFRVTVEDVTDESVSEA